MPAMTKQAVFSTSANSPPEVFTGYTEGATGAPLNSLRTVTSFSEVKASIESSVSNKCMVRLESVINTIAKNAETSARIKICLIVTTMGFAAQGVRAFDVTLLS